MNLSLEKLAKSLNLLAHNRAHSIAEIATALQTMHLKPSHGTGARMLYLWLLAIGKKINKTSIPDSIKENLVTLDKKQLKVTGVNEAVFELVAHFICAERAEQVTYPHKVIVDLQHEEGILQCICVKQVPKLHARIFDSLEFTFQPVPVAGEVPKENSMSHENQQEGFGAAAPVVDTTGWKTRIEVAKTISELPGYGWVFNGELKDKTDSVRVHPRLTVALKDYRLRIPHSDTQTVIGGSHGNPVLHSPGLLQGFMGYFFERYPLKESIHEVENVQASPSLPVFQEILKPSIPTSASWQYLLQSEVINQFGKAVARQLDLPLEYTPELVAIPVAEDRTAGEKAYNLLTVITAAMRLGQYEANSYVQLSQLFEEDYTPQEQSVATLAAETLLGNSSSCTLKGDDGVSYTMVALSEIHELKSLTHAEVEKTRGVTAEEYFRQHYAEVDSLEPLVKAHVMHHIISRFKAIAGDQLYISGATRTITIPKYLLEGADLFGESLSVENFGAMLQIAPGKELAILVQQYLTDIQKKEGKIPWAIRQQNLDDSQALDAPLIPLITVAKYLSVVG